MAFINVVGPEIDDYFKFLDEQHKKRGACLPRGATVAVM